MRGSSESWICLQAPWDPTEQLASLEAAGCLSRAVKGVSATLQPKDGPDTRTFSLCLEHTNCANS